MLFLSLDFDLVNLCPPIFIVLIVDRRVHMFAHNEEGDKDDDCSYYYCPKPPLTRDVFYVGIAI